MKKIVIVIGLLITGLVIFISYPLIINKIKEDNCQKGNDLFFSKSEMKPGVLSVRFDMDISEDEALSILNKYDLKPKDPSTFLTYRWITFRSKDNEFGNLINKIRKMSFVKRADLIEKQISDVEPWIVVDFEKALQEQRLIKS